ncbi:acyltransferase domain-containing protein [Chloropicon primus]|uniref:Acyltransferase 3 domain-containing protein n=2 Tax=Chloropicon primus TaxID=1764295 RepID=A0A5B8MTQ0_9CHLO|nr:hypothetical protein A3770_11p62350 [Chloropicon primus]UPR02930.1 acyltransferase domain-containing protein [Chloropicon primus]|eukprot:QDZ23717.1 hypothetical protein A3770_11p62350 [Chloropicon primus]
MTSNWLAACVSLLFFVEAGWRFYTSVKLGSSVEGSNYSNYVDAVFNGVNFVALGSIGLGFVAWPAVEPFTRRLKERTSTEPTTTEERAEVVVSKTSLPKSFRTIRSRKSLSRRYAQMEEGEDDAQDRAEASARAMTPAGDAPEQPRKEKKILMFLTNLKVTLIIGVVTYHVLEEFYNPEVAGVAQVSSMVRHEDTSRFFYNFTSWLETVCQPFGMGLFLFISAYFCPASLDRKGLRSFVLDKIVRLGGAFILYSALLGPLNQMWITYLGTKQIEYTYDPDIVWFVLWLMNWTIVYAIVAQYVPAIKVGLPHAFVLLLAGAAMSGAYYGLSLGIPRLFMRTGGMEYWNYGLAIYMPMFFAGILGGRNDWMTGLVEMERWLVWLLRVLVVAAWAVAGVYCSQNTELFGLQIGSLGLDPTYFQLLFPGVYSVPISIALIQIYHEFCNGTPQNKVMAFMSNASYAVYVTHKIPVNVVVLTFTQILEASGKTVLFMGSGHSLMWFLKSSDGLPDIPSSAIIWGGFIFCFALTQLVAWPLAFYFRKLPILNQIL